MSEIEDVGSLLTDEIRKGLKEIAIQLENNPDEMAEMPHVDQALLIIQDPERYGYASADVQQDPRVLKYMIRNEGSILEKDQQVILDMIDAHQPVDKIWKHTAEKDPRFVLMHGPDALKMDAKIIRLAMAQLKMDPDSLPSEPKPSEPKSLWMRILKDDPTLFTAAPKDIRKDKKAIIEITQANPRLPYYFPNLLKEDPTFAKQLLQVNGESWAYLNKPKRHTLSRTPGTTRRSNTRNIFA
jgi:hypothetical protein